MNKATRRQQRERLRAERERARRRAQRNKRLAVIAAAILVVVLAVGGGYFYLATVGAPGEYEGETAEQTLQQDGSVVVAEEGAEGPVLEIYTDYQCPACEDFEQTNGATVQELAAEGEAIVHIRPVSIFAVQPDPAAGNSLRGAAAARAAADHGLFVEYSELLWENQPDAQEAGYQPEELAEWGAEVGITDPGFAERVDDESAAAEQFVGYVDTLREAAQAGLPDEELATMTLADLMAWGAGHDVEQPDLEGSFVQEVIDATAAASERYPSGDEHAFQGTPSVYVNGELLGREIQTTRGLRGAVEEAGPGSVDTRPAEEPDRA